LLTHVREVGGYFKSRLEALKEQHECILDVRGMGLMLGLELNSAELAKSVAAQMMERQIIINRTSETVLRFLPPYILERKHVDLAMTALDEILTSSAAYAGTTPVGEHANG
jgi:acetylornithine aminotransferase/acetylornithine/N-succinyldiaminopimelate aminotransferase